MYTDTYNRIKNNIPYDKDFNVYTIKVLNKIINYYESIEEFEKCKVINDFILNRFSHDNNYLSKL